MTVLSDSIPGYHGPKLGALNRMTSLRLRLSAFSKNMTVEFTLSSTFEFVLLYILTRMGEFLLFIEGAFSYSVSSIATELKHERQIDLSHRQSANRVNYFTYLVKC